MGWSVGFDSRWGRDIGYGVPAKCDQPGCNADIDRGLSYVCGGEPYGGEYGCGLYFCEAHLGYAPVDPHTGEITTEDALIDEYGADYERELKVEFYQVCYRCETNRPPYEAKPDTAEWITHKMSDPSWAQWREEQGL